MPDSCVCSIAVSDSFKLGYSSECGLDRRGESATVDTGSSFRCEWNFDGFGSCFVWSAVALFVPDAFDSWCGSPGVVVVRSDKVCVGGGNKPIYGYVSATVGVPGYGGVVWSIVWVVSWVGVGSAMTVFLDLVSTEYVGFLDVSTWCVADDVDVSVVSSEDMCTIVAVSGLGRGADWVVVSSDLSSVVRCVRASDVDVSMVSVGWGSMGSYVGRASILYGGEPVWAPFDSVEWSIGLCLLLRTSYVDIGSGVV